METLRAESPGWTDRWEERKDGRGLLGLSEHEQGQGAARVVKESGSEIRVRERRLERWLHMPQKGAGT